MIIRGSWSRAVVVLGAVTVVALMGLPAVSSNAAPARPAATSFSAHGSAEQVYVTGLAPNAAMSLLDAAGGVVQTKSADSLGGLVFRGVTPGTGYQVRAQAGGAESGALTVYSNAAAPWDPDIYHQSIPADSGYSYLTTRDGTKLAIDIHLPTHPAGEPGLPSGTPLPPAGGFTPPYPTLIEYSGYGYADPAGPVNGIAVIANLMGFAVVDVNMRGTGCSGGAYDFFEPLQNLDGYDVVETIAHQPWVLGNKVGMMGISYGAISQLFTAQLQPPDLEAISPLSTIDATATTLYPGGILNTGFAVAWAAERQFDALPAGPKAGQAYAYQQIQSGDQTCAANQVLHGEAVSLPAKIAANSHYIPAMADPLDPTTFVDKIKAPTFLACQWEDEQTGGHCPNLVSHFTGTSHKWFTFTNGAHIDALDPYTFNRWYDFLELYVAHQAPAVNAAVIHAAAPVIYQSAMGIDSPVTLPVDPIQAIPTYQAALSAFENLPEVRVLFDNGAGSTPLVDGVTPPGAGVPAPAGDPYPGFEDSFSSLPVPGTVARQWYLGSGGTLTDGPPAHGGVDDYTSNPSAVPLADYLGNTGGGGLWANASSWTWNWKQNPAGTAVSYLTSPLSQDTTVVGAGAVHLWVRSSTPDVDLQATISEVRPDGKETFVQNGWVRASERKLATGSHNLLNQPSTLLEPVLSQTAADASPMPAGQFVDVVVPLYYEGHAYRTGSRIRVTIAAPNGTQPVWSFNQPLPPLGTSSAVSIAFSADMPSSLVLPVVPGVAVPTALPACPSLRNEPCRTYQPIVNRAEGDATAPAPAATSLASSRTGSLAVTGWPMWLELLALALTAAGLLGLAGNRRRQRQSRE